MAILQMKRLRLMLVRSQKEELLRELTRLGCVQLVEQEEELQEQESQGMVHRESSDLMTLKTRQAALERAVELLENVFIKICERRTFTGNDDVVNICIGGH